MTYNASVDCTGQYVRINDPSGKVWFHGKAIERVAEGSYRFVVMKIGGRSLDAEVVANVEEMAIAAVSNQ